MPVQGAAANTDSNGKLTTAYYGDRGDGTSNWHHVKRTFDGGDVTQGAKADAAVTNPASSASLVALLKGLLTRLTAGAASVTKLEDDAHASGDAGVQVLAVRRDTAAVSSGTTGDYEPLQTDSTGRLRTLVKRDTTDTLSVAVNTALAASLVVKASAGTLHSIVGYIASGESGWIQLHDATSAPADTAVPKFAYYVGAASAAQPVNIPLPGHVCSTGITLVWSTTGPTKTAGASKMMVAAYYE